MRLRFLLLLFFLMFVAKTLLLFFVETRKLPPPLPTYTVGTTAAAARRLQSRRPAAATARCHVAVVMATHQRGRTLVASEERQATFRRPRYTAVRRPLNTPHNALTSSLRQRHVVLFHHHRRIFMSPLTQAQHSRRTSRHRQLEISAFQTS